MTVEGEALEHLLRGAQVALAVSPPLGLAALERGAAADRDKDVLQQRAPRVVRMDVSGRDRLDVEVLGEVAQEPEPPCVTTLVGTLELDAEALAAERSGQARSGVRIEQPETSTCTPGEADETVVRLRDRLERDGWRQRLAVLPSGTPRPRMRGRQEPTEVRVPAARLDEQRDVRSAVERDLGTRDRPDAERLRGVRELERPVDAVVIRECERLVPELGGARGDLLGL